MVNCPKCGFTQPRDKYCASCGVDMLAFRPVQKPFFQRLVKNTGLQLVLIIAVIAGVFVFARDLNRREVAARIAEIENEKNTQVLSHSTATTVASRSMDSTAETAPADAVPVAEAAQAPAAEETAVAAAPAPQSAPIGSSTSSSTSAEGLVAAADHADAAKPAAAAGAAPTAAAALSTNVQVVFAEVQRSFIADLIAKADPKSISNIGPVTAGIVSNVQARLRTARTGGLWEMLDSSTRPWQASTATEVYAGNRDQQNQFIGFLIEATPTQVDEAGSQTQVRILRILRTASNPPIEEVSLPLPESFTIPKGAAAFITGALPQARGPLNNADRAFYGSTRALRLLTSEEYTNGATDLVIFIEPR